MGRKARDSIFDENEREDGETRDVMSNYQRNQVRIYDTLRPIIDFSAAKLMNGVSVLGGFSKLFLPCLKKVQTSKQNRMYEKLCEASLTRSNQEELE